MVYELHLDENHFLILGYSHKFPNLLLFDLSNMEDNILFMPSFILDHRTMNFMALQEDV